MLAGWGAPSGVGVSWMLPRPRRAYDRHIGTEEIERADRARTRTRREAAGTAAIVLLLALGVALFVHVRAEHHWKLNGRTLSGRNQLTEHVGPSHCGWQQTTFLAFDGVTYVRDEKAEFTFTPVPYDADSTLPPGAAFTGWRDGDRQLYADPETDKRGPLSVYIVSPKGVERWPRFDEGCI
jgi:hypothetical protein